MCLVENIICCKKTVKIDKMVKNGENRPILAKKIAKNGGFLRFFGQNRGVFLVTAPFPAPRNCKILWGPIGAECLEHLVILSKDIHETRMCFVESVNEESR